MKGFIMSSDDSLPGRRYLAPKFNVEEGIETIFSLSPDQVTDYLMSMVNLAQALSPVYMELKKKDQWFLDYGNKKLPGLTHVSSITRFQVCFCPPSFHTERWWGKEQSQLHYKRYEDEYYTLFFRLWSKIKRYSYRLRYLLPIEQAPTTLVFLHLLRLEKVINITNDRLKTADGVEKKRLYQTILPLLDCQAAMRAILQSRASLVLTYKGQ